jgi:hypothetical protein
MSWGTPEMARAAGYFAQAVSAPAVRAALSKMARSHSVAEFVHLLTTHHHGAAEPTLHVWLGVLEQAGGQRIACGSAADNADLNGESLRDLSAFGTRGDTAMNPVVMPPDVRARFGRSLGIGSLPSAPMAGGCTRAMQVSAASALSRRLQKHTSAPPDLFPVGNFTSAPTDVGHHAWLLTT